MHLLETLEDTLESSNPIRDEMDALELDDPMSEENDHYGLLTPEQVVVVRVYGEDGDDQILSELRPRFIVMFDPNMDFVRRIEVCHSLPCASLHLISLF